MPSRKRSQRRPASPAVRATGRRDFIHLKDTTMTRNSQGATPRADVYTRVTDRIIADLEQGVHPWFKPWSAENTTGRIVRPVVFSALHGLNHGCTPCSRSAMMRSVTRV